MNSAAISASAADAMTCLMTFANTVIGPLCICLLLSLFPRKVYPPALDRACVAAVDVTTNQPVMKTGTVLCYLGDEDDGLDGNNDDTYASKTRTCMKKFGSSSRSTISCGIGVVTTAIAAYLLMP